MTFSTVLTSFYLMQRQDEANFGLILGRNHKVIRTFLYIMHGFRVALNPSFDTMGVVVSFVMYRLTRSKTQDIREIMNSCFAFSLFLRIPNVLFLGLNVMFCVIFSRGWWEFITGSWIPSSYCPSRSRAADAAS